jgi:hypothetical protein
MREGSERLTVQVEELRRRDVPREGKICSCRSDKREALKDPVTGLSGPTI